MDKTTKLVKIKRGFIGGGDEYQYGSQVFVTHRSYDGFRSITVKGKIDHPIFRSSRFEGYRPFMKRFRLHLEAIESQTIGNG